MGLDNGVCVRRNEYTNNIRALKHFEEDWERENGYDFEIVYYRKCYNVRSMIFDVVPAAHDGNESDPLTIADIDNIIAGLKSFNAENWDHNLGSIWDWNPYSKKIKQDIKNLKRLKKLMKKYDLEVYFYDSY